MPSVRSTASTLSMRTVNHEREVGADGGVFSACAVGREKTYFISARLNARE